MIHIERIGKMILTLTSESTTEPVSIAEMRTFLRMESTDSTAEDTLIGAYITVARQLAENMTKRSFVTASRSLVINNFPNSTAVIELPRPPLSTASTNISVVYVKDTTAGDTTTVGSTVFTVDPDSEPGRIYPSYGNEWPDNSVREQRNAVRINFITGYTTSVPVPEPIKQWIKIRAAGMYEFREPIITGTFVQELKREFIDGLLDAYRVITIYDVD